MVGPAAAPANTAGSRRANGILQRRHGSWRLNQGTQEKTKTLGRATKSLVEAAICKRPKRPSLAPDKRKPPQTTPVREGLHGRGGQIRTDGLLLPKLKDSKQKSRPGKGDTDRLANASPAASPSAADSGRSPPLQDLAEQLRGLSPQDRRRLRDLLADDSPESDKEVDS